MGGAGTLKTTLALGAVAAILAGCGGTTSGQSTGPRSDAQIEDELREALGSAQRQASEASTGDQLPGGALVIVHSKREARLLKKIEREMLEAELPPV